MKKRIGIISIALCLVLVAAICGISGRATEPRTFTKGSYFTPSSDVYYVTGNSLTQMPNTVEAWICLAEGLKTHERGGVICGNYDGSNKAAMNVEVFTGYHPRALVVGDDGQAQSYVFNKVTLPLGTFTHLAIVRDTQAGKILCYIDGECKQTLSLYGGETVTAKGTYGVGGDQRDNNPQYFRGEIHSVVLFSDVRTAEEIDVDQNAVASNTENLVANWSFEEFTAGQETVADVSGAYGLVKEAEWFADFDAGTYDYSIAVVGDTQRLNEKNPDNYIGLYNWLAGYKNKNGDSLTAVLGVGDVTEHGESWNDEWKRGQQAGEILNQAKVPFTMVVGNHDLYANNDNYFNQAFPVTLFNDKAYWGDKYYWGGSYEGYLGNEDKTNNSYYNIKAGNVEYLIFALEFGPRDEVMEWAGKIIAANPDKQVIITTHAYIWGDGSYVAPGDGSLTPAPSKKLGYNDGDDVWEKLASKYENIRMVICGHISEGLCVQQKTGDKGNTVTEILCDFTTLDTPSTNEGGAGMVMLLHFSDNGNHVQAEVVSGVKSAAGEPAHYKRKNQVSFDVDALDVK